MVICLERGADCLHMVQLMPLPPPNPIISCLIQFQTRFTFLVLANPGCPGEEAVKRVYSSVNGWLVSPVVSVLDSGAEGSVSNRSRDAVR